MGDSFMMSVDASWLVMGDDFTNNIKVQGKDKAAWAGYQL